MLLSSLFAAIVLCSFAAVFAAPAESIGFRFILEYIAQRKPYSDLPLEMLAEFMQHRDDEFKMFVAHAKFIAKAVSIMSLCPKIAYASLVSSSVGFCKAVRLPNGKMNENPIQIEACIQRLYRDCAVPEQVVEAARRACQSARGVDPRITDYSEIREIVNDSLKETCTPLLAYKTFIRMVILLRKKSLLRNELGWKQLKVNPLQEASNAFEAVVVEQVKQAEKLKEIGGVPPLKKDFLKDVTNEREYFDHVLNKFHDIHEIDDLERYLKIGFFDTLKKALKLS